MQLLIRVATAVLGLMLSQIATAQFQFCPGRNVPAGYTITTLSVNGIAASTSQYGFAKPYGTVLYATFSKTGTNGNPETLATEELCRPVANGLDWHKVLNKTTVIQNVSTTVAPNQYQHKYEIKVVTSSYSMCTNVLNGTSKAVLNMFTETNTYILSTFNISGNSTAISRTTTTSSNRTSYTTDINCVGSPGDSWVDGQGEMSSGVVAYAVPANERNNTTLFPLNLRLYNASIIHNNVTDLDITIDMTVSATHISPSLNASAANGMYAFEHENGHLNFKAPLSASNSQILTAIGNRQSFIMSPPYNQASDYSPGMTITNIQKFRSAVGIP